MQLIIQNVINNPTDWDTIKEQYQYTAVNQDGTMWAYANRPIQTVTGFKPDPMNYHPHNCAWVVRVTEGEQTVSNWAESIQRRPQGIGEFVPMLHNNMFPTMWEFQDWCSRHIGQKFVRYNLYPGALNEPYMLCCIEENFYRLISERGTAWSQNSTFGQEVWVKA